MVGEVVFELLTRLSAVVRELSPALDFVGAGPKVIAFLSRFDQVLELFSAPRASISGKSGVGILFRLSAVVIELLAALLSIGAGPKVIAVLSGFDQVPEFFSAPWASVVGQRTFYLLSRLSVVII
jgi:hypothetical protein